MDRVDLKLIWARITNNKGGKQEDLHGRKYRDVAIRFGHQEMRKEYLGDNSWLIK